MPLVFKTPQASADAVEIVGIGYLPAGGVGGVLVADAARRGMAELVEHHDDGTLATNADGTYVVLEGAALTGAARKWAKIHGVEAVDVKDATSASLVAAAGLPEDGYPDARTKAEHEALVILQAPDAAAAAQVQAVADRDEAARTGGAAAAEQEVAT